MLSFRVDGDPKPQGSMRGFVVKGPNGPRAIVTTDKGKGAKSDWRHDVIAAARAEVDGRAPLEAGVYVKLVFVLRPPKSAPKRRRIEPIGRVGDIDKLARLVLDALTIAGAWRDDSQVLFLEASKTYAEAIELPGVHVTVYDYPPPF